MDEILITGLGVISCLGNGVDAFWRGMNEAASAPRRVPDPNAHMDIPMMYGVPEAEVPRAEREPDGQPLGLGSRFALEVSRQAIASAELDGTDPQRIAVVIGTGMGDAGLHEEWRVSGYPERDGWSPTFCVASAVGSLAGAEGPNISVSNACAASGFAISIAADLIRSGEADVVVTGGAEAYSRVALGCFNRLGAVDSRRCRPFDAHREGTVFGEGAAALVLESEEHARRRGAPRAYARLAGAGWSCDAHHTTAIEPEGEQVVRAMRQALRESGVDPSEVGCVVPHGTGTLINDTVESRALSEVLGPVAAKHPLYSLKSLIGHTGGAAGALAALAAVLIVHRGTVPPNVPRDVADPECEVSLPERAVPFDGSAAVVNAYAFGGNNVSLVLQEAGS
ncbi:3-oxoacyl-ACP synthase [Streptomyces abyssalis]|uniref:3-oxoacyl-ACP synthase n=1 Tax=Streptomyces abyssalis TaxID=933944 RepID=A0A1E7JMU1_9ACTN|nr:beta-ketoacyl-[acyl-carrier-protein] synthase family protein [Streptomyces abyssalis]OEU87013.1 3-oxoacyl-ACP synthase [Streptomyces abyssalis]OEU89602.1 3-oxoacyl-ACP synthase [Streptomyces abyssalis]OEV21083.1 3-oxoacyl-ACP synthase [Streptomyces nanshensis]